MRYDGTIHSIRSLSVYMIYICTSTSKFNLAQSAKKKTREEQINKKGEKHTKLTY